MRIFITFFSLFISLNLCAQVTERQLIGNWVKTKVEYKNGEELPDRLQIKSSYLKYDFNKSGTLAMCFDYKSKGMQMIFRLIDGVIEITNSNGYLTNKFLVEKINSNQLVVLQMNNQGFDGPDCVRYYFEPEILYQENIPLTANDIISIRGIDTIYRASQKMYAAYKGDGDFQSYLSENISEYHNVEPTDAHFVATYVVSQQGIADSLHILESINPDFDKQFIKAFNKVKRNWQPAILNGKNVIVRMTCEFRFISGKNFLPSYDYAKKGKDAMRLGQWDQAVYYFDKALENYPGSTDNLYFRAVCKIALGNKAGACLDLMAVKRSGSIEADELIRKNCN